MGTASRMCQKRSSVQQMLGQRPEKHQKSLRNSAESCWPFPEELQRLRKQMLSVCTGSWAKVGAVAGETLWAFSSLCCRYCPGKNSSRSIDGSSDPAHMGCVVLVTCCLDSFARYMAGAANFFSTFCLTVLSNRQQQV